MKDRKLLNEVSTDEQRNEVKYGDKNYFEAVQMLKEDSLRNMDMNGTIFQSDYSAMFMTF